jgi:hypothetical protein
MRMVLALVLLEVLLLVRFHDPESVERHASTLPKA